MTIQAKPPSPAPGRWWSARSWPPSPWRPIPQSADAHADTDHRRAGRHDRGSHADIRGSGDPVVDRETSAFPVRRHDRAGARVRVQQVAPNEGFWVGTIVRDRAWVQLIGTRESDFRVEPGDKVAFREDGRKLSRLRSTS